ncbi:hypothetical protein LY76DRAFT_601044 [Colletotrichum caudatum]|nr:hypothetical protein LY76DRAFT_601044 [Colletotrichum caudatum]
MTEWHDPGGISSCLSCGSIRPERETLPSEREDAENNTVHQPLVSATDIRLLTLLPGDFDDPIKCRLFLGSTASMVDYDAISYTWASEDGEMELTERITLDWRGFLVTPNCADGTAACQKPGGREGHLNRCRLSEPEDVGERGHQVRLMPQIFSRARHVLVYVGEPVPEEERLLQMLQADSVPAMLLHPLRLALQPLLKRRYFSRAWVLQEVALARKATLICGKFSMPWSIVQIPGLAKLGLVIDAKEKHRRPNMLQLPSVLQFRAPAYRDSSGLLQLLDLARHSHATDPRDKLFAVFGLVSCADADGIAPDYTKSTEEVYMRMAGWIAERFGVPAMLVRAFHLAQFGQPEGMVHPARCTSIPSWAHDWTETPAPQSCQVGHGNHQSDVDVAPWAYAKLNMDLNGNKSCGQDTFYFNESLRNSRYFDVQYSDHQIYLLPEPDEYKDFSFEEAGR